MTRRARPLLFALTLCFTSALAVAQSGATKQQPGPPKPETEEIVDSFRTNFVVLHILATDEKGNYITDLKASDISITDDGVPQTVELFAKDESPLRYALVMDNSGSMKPLLPLLVKIGGSLVAANKPGDATALIRFVSSDKIKTLVDFTGGGQQLADGLKNMYIEGGQTAVVEAIYMAVNRVAEVKESAVGLRRAVVIVTDGEDRASYYKLSQLQKLLRESPVPVFAIGLVADLDSEGGFLHPSPRQSAIKLLDTVAKESGGRAYYPRKINDLIAAVNEIARLMRAPYVVGYMPTNVMVDGKFHTLEVKAVNAAGRPPIKIITRQGYFATGVEPADGKKENKKGKS